VIPTCIDQGVGVIPWSPLAGGALARFDTSSTVRGETTGAIMARFMGGNEQVDNSIKERVKQIAEKHNVSMAQIAMAWVLSKPAVTAPIVGITKLPQLEDAIAAVKIKLTEEEQKSLEELYQPKRTSGF
jgi:aryl-alcohol dehydrogenase-like predicted oxidoreductase